MRLPAPKIATVEPGPARVVEAIESTRRELRRCRLSTTMAEIAMGEVAMAATIAVADVDWLLPTWVRGLGLMAMVVLAFTMMLRAVLDPSLRCGKGDAAAEVEATFPELGQRVRTTLEYSEPTPTTAPASRSLVRALVADTDRQARGLEFASIVPWCAFARRAVGLGAAIVAIVLAMAYEPTLRITAGRLLLLPIHYTTLNVEPGDRTVKAGNDFTLRATISGRPVAAARWLRRPVQGRAPWAETALAIPTNPGERRRPLLGTVESVLKDCREDFEYRVVAGEVESDIYRVRVIRPLVLKSLEAAIEPPSYTRRPPSVTREGNFKVPEGSRVRFRIELDRAPRSARLSWEPAGGPTTSPHSIPLKVEGARLSGELPPLIGDVRYEIVADASDGMKLEPARYRIGVQPDEKPTVRFLHPAESYATIPTTEVPFRVEAGDDYGVARVGIVFRINDAPEQSLTLEEPAARPTRIESLATLFLENFKLSYTDSVTYHAFAEDNREPHPRRVSTELRYIDILPYKQAYQFVEGGGACNGSSVTLEELIARQRRALNRAFAHVDDRPVDPMVADRLSKEEAELALATGEFARALASEFGPISALDIAARSMESATVALDSKDIARALPVEQSALASLIQARQNLRKFLSDSKSAGQCRNLDRLQEQRLRKPPAKDGSKEAELARLEQDLRKLAEGQKKSAEEIDPRGGVGASFDRQDESKDLPSKPGKSSGAPASKASMAERQRASAEESGRLKRLAAEDPALTALARSRMSEADRQVKAADAAIGAERPAEAAEAARSAAGQLERLAGQVAALKAKELADRLARARDLAQATARAERALAGGDPTRPSEAVEAQVGLAEETRTLADLLGRAESEALEEDRSLARAIGRASESNPPGEIEQALRQAAAGLASGGSKTLLRAMEAAAGQLENLARDLEAARRDFVQPGLEQLLGAERKAAEVQMDLESASDAARKAEAEKAVSDLARAMRSLRSADGPLRDATDALERATQTGSGVDGWVPPKPAGTRPGFFTPPTATTNAVRGVSRALQARIQELILNDALVDRDGAVPPGYREMVEDYFRLLSEDLR